MRLVQNCLIAFWMLHFAAAGLLRAAPYAREGGAFAIAPDFSTLSAGLTERLPLALGIAEFAIGLLFALALTIRLVGVEEEQADSMRYAQAAAGCAILVLALTHVLNQIAGGDGAALLADMAKATFLALTAFFLQPVVRPRENDVQDPGAPVVHSPYLRAQRAALAVDATKLLKGPPR